MKGDDEGPRCMDFWAELQRFKFMIEDKRPVALARFADGELAILENRDIFALEFHHNRNQSRTRGMLYEAITYRADSYHVGISCKCCGGDDHETLRQLSRQDQEHLTYSNLWVNANWDAAAKILARILEHSVLICSDKATKVTKHQLAISGWSSWNDEALKHVIPGAAVSRGGPVLVAAGPISGWLVMQMHRINPKGQYLDIGSALDPLLGLGTTRGYHRGEGGAGKVCTW